jgi:hypothetical protein
MLLGIVGFRQKKKVSNKKIKRKNKEGRGGDESFFPLKIYRKMVIVMYVSVV